MNLRGIQNFDTVKLKKNPKVDHHPQWNWDRSKNSTILHVETERDSNIQVSSMQKETDHFPKCNITETE
jgi:hypothetical protein